MATTLSSNIRRVGRIPVRNLWLLMLYASDVARYRGVFDAGIDDEIDDLPDLVGRLLVTAISRRLRRGLTRGYRRQLRTMTRVRGRIDVLRTESQQCLQRGEVICAFDEFTLDTPRHRLVRSALELTSRVASDEELRRRCRALATTMATAGIGGSKPSATELALDTVGRNDNDDHQMIALAKLVFDLSLPMEVSGEHRLFSTEDEEKWVRLLFEKAVLGFARVELEPEGWSVRGGVHLKWQAVCSSLQFQELLPRMITDIVLDTPGGTHRVVVDTKFTDILGIGRFEQARLKSQYIYQIYAYVRAQEGLGARWDSCSGLMLHPAVGRGLFEYVEVQGHRITFATVDLTVGARQFRQELRKVLLGSVPVVS